MSRSTPGGAGLVIVAAMVSPAFAGQSGAGAGTIAKFEANFPPSPNPWLVTETAEYRLKLRLCTNPGNCKVASDPNWQITLDTPSGAGGSGPIRRQVITAKSIAAQDGTFLSQALEPGITKISVPPGAPTLYEVAKIRSTYFGRALSIYPVGDTPPFQTMESVIRTGGRPPLTVIRATRTAQAMVWLGVENPISGQWLSCSAFLVTPRLLMTARHCAFPDFSPGSDAKPFRIRAWVRALTPSRDLPPTFDDVRIKWSDTPSNSFSRPLDALVLELPTNPAITSAFPLKLAVNAATENMGLQVPQFPGADDGSMEDPLSISINAPCKAIRVRPDRLFHECNTTEGSSGSPVLNSSLDSGVLGIHTNGYSYGNPDSGNVAVPISQALALVKAQDPSLYQTIEKEQGDIQ